jgi:potassium inwardly-rectifying channel subfamily J
MLSVYFINPCIPVFTENLPGNQSVSGWTPCVLEIDGFASCFLFSLETQHTIGYGSRQTTTECPEAMVLMSLQSVLGCLIQAFMVGLVFSKLSRPSSRSKTVIFSENAVIAQRNRRLCLIFRIGDLRNENFILGTSISAKLLRRRITQEGELYEEMHMLKVLPDTNAENCVFFVWPLDIIHIIDEESPLYDLSASQLAKEKFEIIVLMEGCTETTSMNFQARTSYLPSEILWGHRFEPLMLYRKDTSSRAKAFLKVLHLQSQHCFICCPSDSTVSENERIWTFATLALDRSPLEKNLCLLCSLIFLLIVCVINW